MTVLYKNNLIESTKHIIEGKNMLSKAERFKICQKE